MMSRIGRRRLVLPKGVHLDVDDSVVRVKGPKGTLEERLPPSLSLRVDDDSVLVERKADDRRTRAMHGLVRSLIQNMIVGVTEGFTRSLSIVGVGYRAELSGRELTLYLGYSHKVRYALPDGIDAEVPRPTLIVLRGIDKRLLGQTAATIRSFKEPEPYKGKGIRYAEEKIRHKVGKAGVK